MLIVRSCPRSADAGKLLSSWPAPSTDFLKAWTDLQVGMVICYEDASQKRILRKEQVNKVEIRKGGKDSAKLQFGSLHCVSGVQFGTDLILAKARQAAMRPDSQLQLHLSTSRCIRHRAIARRREV